jgi:hypothetical protein
LLLLATWTVPARAEPSESLREVARNLMAEGRTLREKEDHAAALSRFQAADAIMGVPTTGFEIARSQADLLLLLEAKETLRRVLSLPEKPDDPEPFRAARMKARALDVELTQRIGGVRIMLRGPEREQPKVSVGAIELTSTELEGTVKLNPGRHRIVVLAAGKEHAREVVVPERATLAVSFDLSPEPTPTPAADARAASEPEPQQPPTNAARTDRSAPRHVPTLAYVGGGVAVAGVIVGSVSGAWAMTKKNEGWAGCEGTRCPPETWDTIDSAHRFATISTVSFVVAGVGAGIGAGAWLIGRRSQAGTASLELRATPGRLQLGGTF